MSNHQSEINAFYLICFFGQKNLHKDIKWQIPLHRQQKIYTYPIDLNLKCSNMKIIYIFQMVHLNKYTNKSTAKLSTIFDSICIYYQIAWMAITIFWSKSLLKPSALIYFWNFFRRMIWRDPDCLCSTMPIWNLKKDINRIYSIRITKKFVTKAVLSITAMTIKHY